MIVDRLIFNLSFLGLIRSLFLNTISGKKVKLVSELLFRSLYTQRKKRKERKGKSIKINRIFLHTWNVTRWILRTLDINDGSFSSPLVIIIDRQQIIICCLEQGNKTDANAFYLHFASFLPLFIYLRSRRNQRLETDFQHGTHNEQPLVIFIVRVTFTRAFRVPHSRVINCRDLVDRRFKVSRFSFRPWQIRNEFPSSYSQLLSKYRIPV